MISINLFEFLVIIFLVLDRRSFFTSKNQHHRSPVFPHDVQQIAQGAYRQSVQPLPENIWDGRASRNYP